MRVFKLLVLAGIVGAAGYVAWAKMLRAPEKRACAHLAALCRGEDGEMGDAKSGECADFFAALKSHAPDALERTTSCVDEARSCGQAVGCVAGGGIQIGTGFARDFADGLSKSLHR
jgi:hypothetical protein